MTPQVCLPANLHGLLSISEPRIPVPISVGQSVTQRLAPGPDNVTKAEIRAPEK